MMRCVDGGHASKASHDAQGVRRSLALPRGMSPLGPVAPQGLPIRRYLGE
jgi:hypothetical protein